MPHDVFISHASADAATAQAVLAALEARGIACWIAPRDILPGREWEPSILTALAQAKVVVLVFSGAANASAHVRREVAAAADARVPVVPYRVDRAEMDQALRYYLAGVHWLDAVSGPQERNLAALADTVETLLDRPPPQPGSPAREAGGDSRPARGKRGPTEGGKRRRNLALLQIAAIFALAIVTAVAFSWPMETRSIRVDLPPPSRPPAPTPMQAFESTPEALVRRLYERGAGLSEVPRTLLTPNLRAAEGLRVISEPDEPSRDWRYPGDDAPPFAELAFAPRSTGPRTAEVAVRWGSWPRRRQVIWTLCRLADERWRVADIDAGGRSLRDRNSLPPPDPEGGC